MTRPIPSLFVSHGTPFQALDGAPGTAFWARLGARLPRPCAILCISAHWETPAPTVSSADPVPAIHDFYGFPDELYRVGYAARGAPDLARRVQDLLRGAGIACTANEDYGLDHGAWVPLKAAYPLADIPVTQLSIQQHLGPAHHLRLGAALAGLPAEGVLVLGSGSITHNLGDFMRWMRAGQNQHEAPADWASSFDDWVAATLGSGDYDGLCGYRDRAPGATMAHPRDDHFLPLLAAAGAGGSTPGRRINAGFMYGNLSVAAYAFGDGADEL